MISRESFEHVPLDVSCCLFLFNEIKFGHLHSLAESEMLKFGSVAYASTM
jgi:hypothetical protein